MPKSFLSQLPNKYYTDQVINECRLFFQEVVFKENEKFKEAAR